jgi:hypothetical protein
VEKFNEDEVLKYNLALGIILMFIKRAIEMRELDVQTRKDHYDNQKKNK